MNLLPKSLLDQLVGACASLLAAAVALFLAAHLVAAVWPILLAILGTCLLLGLGVLACRWWWRQRSGW